MSTYDLVADIGGTNGRFALASANTLITSITLATKDFAGLSEAMNAFLDQVGRPHIARVSLAIAGFIEKPVINMTNNHWRINKRVTQAVCGTSVLWLNDFAAQAWGISQVTQTQLLTVKAGEEVPQGNRLVIGPGTGLGVAGLVWGKERWLPIISEGGHTGFAAANTLDIELHKLLLLDRTHLVSEHFLSGTGLPLLYKTLAKLRNQPTSLTTSIAITQAAYPQDSKQLPDPLALETMQVFFRQLGHATANAAVVMGATGGVYLTGGLLPKLREGLLAGHFLEGFLINQSRSRYLQDMPVFLNLDEGLGLKGAAVALRQ